MQTLINDLLTYSKASGAEKKFEKTNLNNLLSEIKNNFVDTIEEKNGSLLIDTLPDINAISFQLRQLFINLISNALKFLRTDAAPKIKVAYSKTKGLDIKNLNSQPLEDYHHFTVSDHGIGFDKEYEHKIFQVFQKLQSKNEYEGTRIVLSICKKITQNHHGFISATSVKNVGSSFHIYLPASL